MGTIKNLNGGAMSRVKAAAKSARIGPMIASLFVAVAFAFAAGGCNKTETEAPAAKDRPGKGDQTKGGQAKGGQAKGGRGRGDAAKGRPSKAEQDAQRKQIASLLIHDKAGLRNQLAPNATTEYKGGRMSTNQWGMRDKDYALTPAPGTRRIAVLGPSHAFGGGVNDGETFEQLLEDRLNREVSPRSRLKFEVLNFAVLNYTLIQHSIILSNGRVGAFQPDTVLIVGHQADLRGIADYVWREIQAGRSLPDRIDQVVRKAAVTSDMQQAAALKKLLPYAEDVAELLLKEASAEIRKMAAEPVYALIPIPARRAAQKESQLLIGLARAAGFQTLDLSDIFQKTDVTKLTLSATDSQPNAEGHRQIARRLFDGLTKIPTVVAADSPDTAKRKAAVRVEWNRENLARKKAAEAKASEPAKAAKPVPAVPMEGWTIEAPDGGVATLESSKRDNWLRVYITRAPKSASSRITVRKAPVPITSGQRYVLSLFLKADAERAVGCRVAEGGPSLKPLGESTDLQVPTWWQEFSCPFTATGTSKTAQIVLDLGTRATGLELSNLQLKNLSTGEVVLSTDPAWRQPARTPK